jgi:hypothetical protein
MAEKIWEIRAYGLFYYKEICFDAAWSCERKKRLCAVVQLNM